MKKEEAIKNTPLFGELSADEQHAIAQRMRLEQYGPGETLFVKNGESDALYLIREGWVKLSDGEGSSVASLGPGSLLGETDFLSGRAYTMTARTSSDVTVWTLEQAALTNLIEERPELGIYLGLAFGKGIVQFHRHLAERLGAVSLLQDLSLRERSLIAQYLSPQRYYSGETIYRSGDSPIGLFVVETGAIHLLGDTDDDYTELTHGEAFGEMAVVSNTPHSNTAQAANETILWQLSPADFATLTQTNPTIKTNLSRNLRARLSASDQAYAVALLERVPLFSGLTRDVVTNIVRLLLLRHVPAGEIIFSQGDPGDAMYIVDSGSVAADSPKTPGQMKYRFRDGDIFGETALLTGKTRNFTAHATSDTNLWCLYRTDFDNLLVKHPQISAALSQALRDRLDAVDEYAVEPHLQKIAVAGGLTRTQLDELSARLQPRRYEGGSTIYFEGSSSDGMYFIERGQVELWGNTAQGPMLLESLAEGDYFGEIALLSGRPRLGTAYAIVETVIWALSKDDFDDFLQRYPNLGVVMSRILSQRMEDTMARLRGTAAQQSGLPAPGASSQSRPTYPASNRPTAYPSGPGRNLRPVSRPALPGPPVPLRPAAPPRSRPPAALPPPSSRSRPVQPRPPMSGQPTQPFRPVPSVNLQQTQPMPPVRPTSRPAAPVQHTQPMSARPAPPPQTAPPKKQTKSTKPRRKVRKKKKQPPTRSMTAIAAPQPKPAPQEKPVSAAARTSSRQREKTQGTGRQSRFGVPARSISNRTLEEHRKSVSVWFANRSLGAKLRLLAICIALVWLCGIMVPSLIINALASTFADEGASPGDVRSPLQQMREDGAVGAAAMLPFVETATPTPTNSPTPTSTPTQTSTPTPTPIPSNTPTPTLTPTPTDTPTPVFTPTPTNTATRPAPRAPLAPTDTPTPEPTPTPDVDYRVKSVRQLTPCENQGKHHIFVKVEDATGQGVNDVPVKVEWAAVPDGHVVVQTETKTNLTGQPEPGRFDFAMFKGSYVVEVLAGSSEVAGPVTPDYGTNEPCGENAVANSLFHISYEIIFQRTF